MLILTDSNILLVPSLFNEQQLYEMCSFLKCAYLFIVYLLPLITDYDLGINPVLKFFLFPDILGSC